MKKNGKLDDLQIASFCEQIHMVIQAGLPIHQGISILMEDAKDQETTDFLNQIYTPMEQGSQFYNALEATHKFPDYMLRMIRLGEETGKMEDVLASISDYYKKEADIKSTLRYAVTYPIFMFFMVLAVVVILITKVLPVFADIYESLGTQVTGSAQVLMHISIALNRYMMVFLLTIVVIFGILFILYKSLKCKRLLQKMDLFESIALSRFSNCMYLAISSGLNTDYGLDLAQELIGDNSYLCKKIEDCRILMTQGKSLSDSLYEARIFPKMFASWMNISYLSGNADQVMKNICEEYEKNTNQKISSFISVLEPTLVIILSVIVGLILISFLLPLLGIMSSIGA